MTVMKCDNCGDIYDYGTGNPEAVSFHYYRKEDGTAILINGVDICPECYKAIKRALDGRKAIANRTEDDLK